VADAANESSAQGGFPRVRPPNSFLSLLLSLIFCSYNGGSPSCEFGDFSVIHCLTGWLPEIIPLQWVHQRLAACSSLMLSPHSSLSHTWVE
jgi:hypothetical protein